MEDNIASKSLVLLKFWRLREPIIVVAVEN